MARWVAHLRPYNDDFHRTLATSSGDAWTQFVHHLTTQAWCEGDLIHFDFTAIDRLPTMPLRDSFLIKIAVAEGSRFVSEDLGLKTLWDARMRYFRLQVQRRTTAGRTSLRLILPR